MSLSDYHDQIGRIIVMIAMCCIIFSKHPSTLEKAVASVVFILCLYLF